MPKSSKKQSPRVVSPAKKPAVVFLTSFEKISPPLFVIDLLRVSGYEVYVPDLPTFIRETKYLTPETLLEFLTQYLSKNHLVRPVIIGYSFGATLAAMLNGLRPELTHAKTILISPLPTRLNLAERLRLKRCKDELLSDFQYRRMAKFLAQHAVGDYRLNKQIGLMVSQTQIVNHPKPLRALADQLGVKPGIFRRDLERPEEEFLFNCSPQIIRLVAQQILKFLEE